MNKPMNAYPPYLYVNDRTSWEKSPPRVKYLRLHFRINLHTKTNLHTIKKEPAKILSIYLFTNMFLYNHAYNTHSLKTNICHFIHYKSIKKIITSSIIMSKHIDIWKGGWQSYNGVSEHISRNPSGNSWPRTTHPKAPGCYLKRQKRSEGLLIDNHPTIRVKIEKGGLFDLILAEILSIINDWSSSFKYNDKCITLMNRIIQKSPFLRKLQYTKMKPFHNFRPILFYGTASYEWAHRHYKKHCTRYGPKTHLTKNKLTWAA